ncbi:cell division control protein 45 [Aphis craccivora]|uniref:Cell division control protein 45 n=1 Tax=Aphis craccivora TaxID=307492 RepID=A0A6G0YPD6_APHCR|nr:cell division control protein 45 [Aphis craccivora]
MSVIPDYLIYNSLKILILVNYDVDAICAVKMLQSILRFDNIVYVLVPVKTVTEYLNENESSDNKDVDSVELMMRKSQILSMSIALKSNKTKGEYLIKAH